MEVANGIKSWITHLLSSAGRQEAISGLYNSAISEGLSPYSKIHNLTIKNFTPNEIPLNAFFFFGSPVFFFFSAVMVGLCWKFERGKSPYLISQSSTLYLTTFFHNKSEVYALNTNTVMLWWTSKNLPFAVRSSFVSPQTTELILGLAYCLALRAPTSTLKFVTKFWSQVPTWLQATMSQNVNWWELVLATVMHTIN